MFKHILLAIAMLSATAVASTNENEPPFLFIVHCGNDHYQFKSNDVLILKNGLLEVKTIDKRTVHCLGWEIFTATSSFSNDKYKARPNTITGKGFTNGGIEVKDDHITDLYPSKDKKLRARIALAKDVRIPYETDYDRQITGRTVTSSTPITPVTPVYSQPQTYRQPTYQPPSYQVPTYQNPNFGYHHIPVGAMRTYVMDQYGNLILVR